MATPNLSSSYSSHNHTLHDNPPPAYIFPETFRIGTSTIEPVVRVSQIKGHLALLRAFADLRTQIEDLDATTAGRLPHFPSRREGRWIWFVDQAVERFERWCLALTPGTASAEGSPDQVLRALPLDVIMVLHSYLLNPLWFWEDCLRVPKLAGLECYAGLLGGMLETPEILTAPPTDSEIGQWTVMTSTPFDYLESAIVLKTRTIDCPKCLGRIEAALMDADGRGYLQANFITICQHCSFEIWAEPLAIRRICSDLISQDVSSLAGTLCTPTGVDPGRGQSIKEFMMRAPELQRPSGKYSRALSDSEWLLHMAAEVGYSFSRLRDVMAPTSKAKGAGLLTRILDAYSNDRVFSVDLRGAVLRQGSFITKMYKLGWTEPQFFDPKEDGVALQHIIARYHAFLDLFSSSPTSFFVPTLDIDLAWHTHQLMAEHYKTACMDHVGRFINHDDKVDASQLSSAFDATCRAWKHRFNVDYMHCGCPLPGQTIGQKLSRLVNRYNLSASHLTTPARYDFLAATHPSDHNAIFPAYSKPVTDEQWRKRNRRQDRETQEVRKGKADPARAGRSIGHFPAFLVPVPIYYPFPDRASQGYNTYTPSTGNAVSGNAGGASTNAAGASACGGDGGGGDAGGGDAGDGGGGACGGGGCGGGGCGGGGGGD